MHTSTWNQLHRCLKSRSQYQLLYDHTCISFSLLASTLHYSTTNCTQKARSLFREHMHSRKEFICWNNLSLFCCHLQEILFVNFEEPPPLLSGQIRGTPSLIEPDRRFIPLCHKEVHTAAAGPHSNLQKRATHFHQQLQMMSPVRTGETTQQLFIIKGHQVHSVSHFSTCHCSTDSRQCFKLSSILSTPLI